MKKSLLIILITLFCSSVVYADDNFTQGKNLMNEGKYKEAVEEFKLAIKAAPNSGEVYFQLGKAYNQTGEYELAQRCFQKAVELGMANNNIAYELGYSYERLYYYKEAIDQFNIALPNTSYVPDKAKVYFELGYCYFKMGKYSEAIDNFDKAVQTDGNIAAKSHLYKGIVKYEQNLYDDALAELKTSLDNKPDDITKASAENYLSVVRSKKKRMNSFSLAVSLSFVYDDNVINVNDSEAISVSDKADIGGVWYIKGTYYPIKSDENTLSVNYMYYQKLYQDLSEYNLKDHNAALSYTTALGKFGALSMTYDYNYYLLDNEKYFQKHRVRPTLRINETKNSYLEINGLVNTDDYFSQEDLTSTNFGGGLTQTFKFSDDGDGKLYLSVDYNKEDTKSELYEYSGLNFQVGFNVPIFWDMQLGVDGGYYNKKYDHETTTDVKRDDKVKSVFVKVNKPIGDFFSASLGYDYTFNDSNILSYDYKRNVVSVEIKYLY